MNEFERSAAQELVFHAKNMGGFGKEEQIILDNLSVMLSERDYLGGMTLLTIVNLVNNVLAMKPVENTNG